MRGRSSVDHWVAARSASHSDPTLALPGPPPCTELFSLPLEQKFDPTGQQTCSAHPARFSPDDKYSRHRITVKKRFRVLMTQQPRPVL